MALERSCRSELAQLVSDHILGNVDRNVPLAVMHAERQPNHVGRNRRAPRPGANHLGPLATRAHARDHLANALIDPGTFFY